MHRRERRCTPRRRLSQQWADSNAQSALLQGARGQAPADIEALIDCIERVSWLAADCVDKIAEIDINPLCVLALGQGVRVVDALVIPIC